MKTLSLRAQMGWVGAGYAAVLAEVVLMALVTAMTSRYTVYRMLDTVQ